MSVHLFTRSSYSLLQSTIRIPQLVQYAKKMGYRAVSLTDHNVMFGVASFIHACKQENLQPIVGMEVDCKYHEEIVPFVLLAKDNEGYKQLMKLSSYLNEVENTCTLHHLQDASIHCHVIVYGEGGWFDGELVNEDGEGVRHKLEILKKDLGEFDVGLSYMEASLWKMRNAMLKRICQSMKIPTVAFNKIYYLEKEDAESLRVLQGIATNRTIHDASLTMVKGRYFLSQDEMHALYAEDDLLRSETIASLCRADYQLPKTTLCTYPIKQNIDAKTYLKQLCIAGLKKRLHNQFQQSYMDRLLYELSVITKMHFENYFLIVYDFICDARKKGIYIGPGRGSAAGSLVAYCLGITMIDPMQYHLLFERFLNPDRISMPDIDVDIPDKNRNEVIQYVYDKYGEDHVCNIVTFGTLGPRQVLRDVGKVMNMYNRDIDMVTKLIPASSKMSLLETYASSTRLKQLIASESKFQKLFQMAVKLEGLPRHTSIHAGGILMSSHDINDVIPTMRTQSEMRTSQYAMAYLEERGLIKMDFLGLRNLSIIDEIAKQIQKRNPTFQILQIPVNDKNTYRIFATGDTVGIFQFESDGITNLIQRIQPQNINDIAIALALYRPGPMDNIQTYFAHRKNPSAFTYPIQAIQPILQETCGIMIYQEQIMLIARKVASFSLAKADVLRKAISKKNEKEMNHLKTDFMQGALKNGYEEKVVSALFDEIEKFAGYGFNKSHAIAYAYISYQMAYLKANYPFDFYIALLNNAMHDTTKTSQYMDALRRRNIQILYPSIQKSTSYYKQENNGIRIPLSAIKAIGSRISDILVEERNVRGEFEDFFDFVARCHIHNIKRQQIESLIDAGSCDCFHETRMTLKYALDQAESYANVVQIHTNNEIRLDLGLVSKPVMMKRKEDEDIKEEYERRALGFTLAPSRLTQIRKQYHIQLPSLATVIERKGNIESLACIKEVKEHRTKKGTMMAFLKIADESKEVDMMVMPRQYTKYASALLKGRYIVFRAKIQEDGAIFCESIQFLNDMKGK